jgi:hypothetical protein
MPTNEIKQIASSVGANVATQANFAANAAILANGFSSGVVDSLTFNKILRQSSFVSAMVAQFIADNQANNVVDDGNLANLEAYFTAALKGAMPGRLVGVQVFTASGTYTPTAGMTTAVVEVQGGGGAGGGSVATAAAQYSMSGGGGSGAYGRGRFTAAQIGASQAITVGAGGTGVSGGTGGSGGTSSFGALLTASGGAGGGAMPATSSSVVSLQGGGAGGSSVSGALVAENGIQGANGYVLNNNIATGGGGASKFGGGAPIGGVGTGTAAVSKGSGGAGAGSNVSDTAKVGGAGAAGIVIIFEYA